MLGRRLRRRPNIKPVWDEPLGRAKLEQPPSVNPSQRSSRAFKFYLSNILNECNISDMELDIYLPTDIIIKMFK